MKKTKLKLYILFVMLVAVCVALDQITKHFTAGKNISVISGLFEIYYTQNTGVAFSFLSGKAWVFIPISAVCIIALILIFILNKKNSTLLTISLALLVGGAAGNMIDRIYLSYVRDFLYITFFPAIFNFADVCVTVGTILLIIYLIFFLGREKSHEKNI